MAVCINPITLLDHFCLLQICAKTDSNQSIKLARCEVYCTAKYHVVEIPCKPGQVSLPRWFLVLMASQKWLIKTTMVVVRWKREHARRPPNVYPSHRADVNDDGQITLYFFFFLAFHGFRFKSAIPRLFRDRLL